MHISRQKVSIVVPVNVGITLDPNTNQGRRGMPKSETVKSLQQILYMPGGVAYSCLLPYDACSFDGFLFFVMGNNPLIDDQNSVHFETRQAVIVAQTELQKNSLQD